MFGNVIRIGSRRIHLHQTAYILRFNPINHVVKVGTNVRILAQQHPVQHDFKHNMTDCIQSFIKTVKFTLFYSCGNQCRIFLKKRRLMKMAIHKIMLLYPTCQRRQFRNICVHKLLRVQFNYLACPVGVIR